jgi:hypothetical protein
MNAFRLNSRLRWLVPVKCKHEREDAGLTGYAILIRVTMIRVQPESFRKKA